MRSGTKSSTRKVCAGDRRLLGIGVDRNRPGAAHGGGRQRRGRRHGRRPTRRRETMRRSSTPSGRVEDEGERQVLDRIGGAVAGKRGDMHGFAGAVDAALGPGIDVERARRGAAGDAAVGQVEAGAGHVEEDEVARRRCVAISTAGTMPPSPRVRPGLKVARPSASVLAVPRISLLLASSVSSTPAIGLAVPSERAKTLSPSWPV